MSRTAQFIRGAALSGGGTIISVAAALALAKLATAQLPPDLVAYWLLAVLLADGFNLLSNFGLYASLPKLVATQPPQDRVPFIQGILRGQVCVSIIAALVFVLVVLIAYIIAAPYVAEPAVLQFMPGLRPIFIFVPLLIITGALRDTLLAALNGLHAYAAHALGTTFLALSQLAIAALLIVGYDLALSGLMLALIFGQVTGVLILWLLATGLAPWRPLPVYWKSVRFSLPLYTNSLLNYGFQRADTYLVTALLGVHATALYEIAKRFPMLLSRGINALLLPWLPQISELADAREFPRAARALTELLIAVTFLGHLAILLAMTLDHRLIYLIATDEYLEAAAVIPLLLIGIHLAVQAGLFGRALIALDRPAWVTLAMAAQAILSLGGSALLLPAYGLPGAGYAWIAGTATSLLIQAAITHRAGIRWNPLPWLLLLATLAYPAYLAAQGQGLIATAAYLLLGGAITTYSLRARFTSLLGR